MTDSVGVESARVFKHSARYRATGGDHTRLPSCDLEQAQAMRIEVFQYLRRRKTPQSPSRYPVGRSVALLWGTLHGNARGTRR